MNETAIKFLLATFSFILGTIGTIAITFYFQEDRVIAYSIDEIPRVRILKTFPLNLDDSAPQENVSIFVANIENIGDAKVTNFSVLIESNGRLRFVDIESKPSREVQYGEKTDVLDGEFRIPEITLEPAQSVRISARVNSEDAPKIKLYHRSNVDSETFEWKQVSPSNNLTLRDNIFDLFWHIILSIIVPGVIKYIHRAFEIFFLDRKKGQDSQLPGVIGHVSTIFSRFVFYGLLFLMVAPAKSAIEQSLAMLSSDESQGISISSENSVAAGGNIEVKGNIYVGPPDPSLGQKGEGHMERAKRALFASSASPKSAHSPSRTPQEFVLAHPDSSVGLVQSPFQLHGFLEFLLRISITVSQRVNVLTKVPFNLLQQKTRIYENRLEASGNINASIRLRIGNGYGVAIVEVEQRPRSECPFMGKFAPNLVVEMGQDTVSGSL